MRLAGRTSPRKYASLFSPKAVEPYWDVIMLMCEKLIIPDLDPDVFSRAFKGYLAWKDNSILVRAFSGWRVDAPPFVQTLNVRLRTAPGKRKKARSIRSMCLMSESYRPKVLYVTTKFMDAMRIRYAVTSVEGVPPSVLFCSKVAFTRAFINLDPICRPDRTILLTGEGAAGDWVKAGNRCDLLLPARIGAPTYLATRILEDELVRPTLSYLNDSGLTVITPALIREALANLGVTYCPVYESASIVKMPSGFEVEHMEKKMHRLITKSGA